MSGPRKSFNASLYRSAEWFGCVFFRKPETVVGELWRSPDTSHVGLRYPRPIQNPSRTTRLHPPHFLPFLLPLLPSSPLHNPGRHATPLPDLYVSVTFSVSAVLHSVSPSLPFNSCPSTTPLGTIRYGYTHHARQMFDELP